jgi:chromate transport protein ChrA
MILLELFLYFVMISMLAFGGGNAVISLLEQISVEACNGSRRAISQRRSASLTSHPAPY